MKTFLIAALTIGSVSVNARASAQSESIATIFARGVFAQMDRSLKAQDPKAEVKYDLHESKASQPNNEIYKALRFTNNGTSCGIVVRVANSVPSLETDIDCGK